MITQQTIYIFLALGFVFTILPVLIHIFIRAYNFGFFPRIGKGSKKRLVNRDG